MGTTSTFWLRRQARADLRARPRRMLLLELVTAAREDLAKSEAILVAAIEVNVPKLVAARKAIGTFNL